MLVWEGTKVFGVTKSTCHISLAAYIAGIKVYGVIGVYIPPVKVEFTYTKYAEIWDSIVELVYSLQLKFSIAADCSIIMGKFNAHIG